MEEGEEKGKFCDVDDKGAASEHEDAGACCRSGQSNQTVMEKIQHFLDVVSFNIQRFLEGHFYR